MRFRKGSRVEVLTLKESPYGAWRTAEILSGNGHTYIVRYYSFGFAKDETLEERVARKMIRPCPPLIDVYRWESGELVEVLDHVFWKPATVLKELSGRYYAVRLLGSASVELTVHKVNLRGRQSWRDERWGLIEKVSCSVKSSTLTGSYVNQKKLKPRERSVVSIRLVKRPSPCESAESCTGTPKKMRLTEGGAATCCQMVRVRTKRFSDDACSVGSCSPIRYDESTSFLDGGSSQDADSYTSDAESSKGCRQEVRRSCRPELSTYRSTLGKLFAQGPLNWDQEASLTDLRLSLNISNDEHLMEIRNLTSSAGTSLQCGISCYILFFSKRVLIVMICIGNRVEESMYGNSNPYCDVLLLIVSLIFFCYTFGILNYEMLQYICFNISHVLRIEFFFWSSFIDLRFRFCWISYLYFHYYWLDYGTSLHFFRNSAADLASRDLYSDALGLPIRAKHEAPSYSNT
ncbi:uncharacterized protein LOC117133777 isoform X1 [Brassica rapa]|uniref:uncharacterized protein LOC117133777 isoform X1 n=1 Tax=Brassica campestris TaxID=3711 RepID=UPI00142DAB02|nr:uncharacterized protein LOC117133777 isoform X1 [Brassica rapa]